MDSIFQGRTRCIVNPQIPLPVYLYLLLHRGILLVITEVQKKKSRESSGQVCALGVYPIGAEAQRTGSTCRVTRYHESRHQSRPRHSPSLVDHRSARWLNLADVDATFAHNTWQASEAVIGSKCTDSAMEATSGGDSSSSSSSSSSSASSGHRRLMAWSGQGALSLVMLAQCAPGTAAFREGDWVASS